MKPIIVCGYRHTGKTTFIRKLIKTIKERGHSVAVIKHLGSGHEARLEDADTTRYLKEGADMSLGFGTGITIRYEINEKEKKENEKSIRYKIHNLLMASGKDFILLEGFKNYNGPIPKIVFGGTKEEIDSLMDDFTIAYSGINAEDYDLPIPYLPFNIDSKKLYRFINEHTVPFVADLDCGECGYPTCRDFSKALMKKEVSINSCIPMSADVRLSINNKPVYLKGFVRYILRDVIIGFVKNLHDYEEGDIKITIKNINP